MPTTVMKNAHTSVQYASIAASKPRDGFGWYGVERAPSCDCWRRRMKKSTPNATRAGHSSIRLTTALRLKSCRPMISL